MIKILQKEKTKYVIMSLDNDGQIIYLRSLPDNKWDTTPNIEQATKMDNQRLANMVLEDYYFDTHSAEQEWLIMSMVVEYYLCDEWGQINVLKDNQYQNI